MVEIYKKTQQRYTRPNHSGDLIIDAKGPASLSQEKVSVIGGYTDYTGSGGVPTKQQMFFTGADKLWATNAYLIDARLKNLGVLGEHKEIVRLRRKKIYVE